MDRWTVSMALLCAQALATVSAVQAQTPLAGDPPAVKVGDTWRWVRSDRRTGLKEHENVRTIKSVAADRIEAVETDGSALYTGDMSAVETAWWVRTPPARFALYPLAVGKKWEFDYVQNNKTGNRAKVRWQYSAEVAAQEKVKVPAGEFDTFKLVYKGSWNNDTSGRSGRAALTTWYAPAARGTVKIEYEDGTNYNVTELVELKLQP